MEENYEAILTGYPTVINLDCTKEIINQMEKNICKIKVREKQGTGFFCKIPFSNNNNMLKVFITNNHIINEDILYKEDETISIYIEEEKHIRTLNLNNRIKYTKKKEEYDITIIEIKEEDGINNFLELDDRIINNIITNKNENEYYIDKTFYIPQYPDGDLSVSYGVIVNIFIDKKYKFNHKCCTKGGSSGSPILNLKNKVIGLHKGGNSSNNNGIFLDEPIIDFIKEYNNKKTNSKYSQQEEENNGLLKLCLLKEISSKLRNNNIMNSSEFFSFIMQNLKNINIKYINNSKNEIKTLLNLIEKRNILNFSDFIDETLNIKQINELMNFLETDNIEKINGLKLNLLKYKEELKLFNKEFEQAKRGSIFEFSINSLVINERKDYDKFKQERENCPNRIDKLLFHGTGVDPISYILNGFFIKTEEKGYQHGKGVYFTDFLDYCWYFCEGNKRGNINIIPKVGDNFTLVACSIFYDINYFLRVYYYKHIPKKHGINFAYVDAKCETIKDYFPDFTKFVSNEYVIYDLSQIFSFIGAKLERNEYCIIWRDNNFFTNNILNNDEFNSLKKNYLKERIRYIKQNSKYNLYPCKTSEEALKLLERKKYNKIILLSNIGSNLEGKIFVDNARKILGNHIIVLFISYNTDNLKWIQNYKNALFSNDPNFIEEYLKSFEDTHNIEDKIKSLIKKCENYYKVKFNFDNNFLYYPYFKNEGHYSDLTFNI